MPYGDACFRYFTTLKRWADAEAHCQDVGGHLASIEDNDENYAVIANIVEPGLTWIGLNDQNVEGLFQWVDGSVFSYEGWADNEPGMTGNDHDCVTISPTGKWYDVLCVLYYTYVCQITL